jgi:RNA recognition motif-containing protein
VIVNIFVGHLAENVTAEDLRKAFAGFGTVINAIVMKDTANGRPLGYGHVYLVPDDAAREAIAALHLVPLKGQPVVVRECIARSGRDRRRTPNRPWLGPERRRGIERRRNGLGLPSHRVTE